MRNVKFLLFLICSLFVRIGVYAYDFKVNGLCYNKLSDSTVEVTWEDINKPYTGDVVVPSYVNYSGKRYDVVAIGDCAMVSVQSVRQNEVYGWKDNHEINSISLPSTILSIGRAAFDGCSGLFSITIPNSVTNIGRQAFSRCIGLISIIIPSSVTSIASSAFNMCSGLIAIRVESGNTMYDSRNECNAIIETSTNSLIQGCKNTTIPNSVTSIGSYAFDECTSLTSINIPNSLTSIGSYAFRGCSSLTSINIPNSVTTIEEDAFSGCNGLSSLTIPNSVTDIGRSAFSNCDGLNSIKVESSNKKYDSRNGCNAIIETATSTLMVGCKNTIIPISVTSIGYGAFKGCINLTSITIPNSVMSIGGFAFSGCSGLTSLTIPSSVTNIDESAFSNCSGLSSLTIPNSVAIISRSAFRNCIGLTSITIPNSVASIGDLAFSGCSNLTSVVSEIVSPFEISSDVFSDYSRLTLTVPRGTKSKYQATNYWNKFTNIVEASGGDTSTKRTIHVATAGTLPNLISESEKYTIEELTLTGELNGTDFRLLRDMAGNNYLGQDTEGKLKVLDMSEVTIVYGGEHYVATNSLPDWSGQFRYTVWKSDEMPRHVFHGCKLKEVHMPNTLKSILDGAFARCKELTSVIIHNNVTSIENDVFNGCTGLTSITIPNSVTSMGSSVFYGCSGLTSISIPNSVTSIGSSVFYGCGSLTSVSIPNSVSSIETNSFRDCSNLSTITIPNSVTSIGDFAFYQCNNLTSITIPNSVTSIGNSVFYGCNSLASIKVESGNTSYDSRNGCNAIIETATNTLIVGCMNTTIPNDILSIGSHAFRGCTGIKSIIIPSKVTYIGDYAFRDCSNLSSIEIPKSVTSIGNGAFCYCSSLSSITLPRDMTSIGSSAFYRCKNMYSILSEIIEPFEIEESVFWNIGSNATLTVPKGTKSKYQATNYWNKFTNIVEASGGDMATKRTIHVATAGTLPNLITESEKYTIEELTLTGELNGTDFRLLRDMAGNNYLGQNTEGKLKVLDISGARIVAGGEKYLDTDKVAGISYASTYHHEILQNDEIPDWVFFACNLNKIVLPNSVTTIGFESFGFCRKLASIIMPNSLMGIGCYSFHNCIVLTSIIIPNSVTYIDLYAFEGCIGLSSITIPKSVTSIASSAFNDCSGLTSIKVEEGNAIYDSRNGCNAIIETSIIDSSWSTLVLGCKNTVIPNTVTSIGDYAFYGCSGLTSITIPNSVKKIYSNAFRGCSGLTSLIIPNSVVSIESHAFEDCSSLSSITIPNSLTSIGLSVFSGCGGLTSIISEIVDPFEISDDVFSDYTKATLTVPSGTKSKYQATNYWNKFTNIVEASGGSTATEVTFTSNQITYKGTVSSKTAEVKSVNAGVTDLEIPSSVSYDGTTYQVTSIADDALSNRTFNYVSLPSTVKSISSSTFYNSKLGALIWNASASLSQSVFSNMGMPVNSNFLLYVNSTSYAPSNVKNVVINSSAQTILLSDDGGDFYCPKAFTAQSISYTHNYSMTTGGSGKGWETLALPFDVQKIEHKTKGSLTPFALYDTNSSSQRPFWLYELGSSGFRRSEGIKANTPYIISMPNSTSYDSEYILTGDVTFSASSVQVRASNSVTAPVSGSKRFVPAFSSVARSSSVYALNVSNQKVSNSSSYDSGSRFISNLRSVYPFEAYMTTSSSGARMLNIGIEFEDDATDIDIIPSANGEQGVVKVYSLNGTLVLQTDRESLQKQWEPLPAGIYIVNGKKMVK